MHVSGLRVLVGSFLVSECGDGFAVPKYKKWLMSSFNCICWKNIATRRAGDG